MQINKESKKQIQKDRNKKRRARKTLEWARKNPKISFRNFKNHKLQVVKKSNKKKYLK